MALEVTDLAVALRIIADPVGTLPAAQEGVLTRLLAVAATVADTYAPNAPCAIRDEAAVRVAGWLYDRPPEAHTRGHSAILQSGAQSLLAPWRDIGGLADESETMTMTTSLEIPVAADATVTLRRTAGIGSVRLTWQLPAELTVEVSDFAQPGVADWLVAGGNNEGILAVPGDGWQWLRFTADANTVVVVASTATYGKA